MDFFTIFLLVLSLLFIFKRCYSMNASSQKNSSLPSPPRLPIIGNLHQLGVLPHRTLHSLAQKYGPLMLLHFAKVPVLVVSSADAARELLKTHELAIAERPQTKVWKILTYNAKGLPISPYGEYWRQLRTVSALHLLSSKRVQWYGRVREEETCRMMENIKKYCSSSLPVNLTELCGAVTNDIACRVFLGRRFHGGEGKKFQKLLMELGELVGTVSAGDCIPWLDWLNKVNGLFGRAHKVAKHLDQFIVEAVEEHIRKGNVDADSTEKQSDYDFVDVLLSIEKTNSVGIPIDRIAIKALILDVFGASIDTTYTTLEWTMAELLKHPTVMQKLKDEVRSVVGKKTFICEDDLGPMNYLKAVIKETLRYHPPFPFVRRKCTKDIKVNGYDIEAGMDIMVNVWSISRDPSSWDQPLEFKPERFLNSSIDFKGHDFEFIPFGAGRRGCCPGITFSMIITELVIANLVHQFDWVVGEDLDMVETVGLVAHRKYHLLALPTISKGN